MIIPRIIEDINVSYHSAYSDICAGCSTNGVVYIKDSYNEFRCTFNIYQLEKVMDVLSEMEKDYDENGEDYEDDDFDFSPSEIYDYFGKEVALIDWNFILRSRAYIIYGTLVDLKNKLNKQCDDIDIKSIDKKELLAFSTECLYGILDKINSKTNHLDSSSKHRKENVE